VLSNVVAGLTIIFTKPFRVGEYVEIVGVRGDVATIELFSTSAAAACAWAWVRPTCGC
jgi:small conductance mechanosensitive channel